MMPWRVVEVKVKEHLRLKVCFVDGLEGEVQFLPSHLTGVFTKLRDPNFFEEVYVDDGAVAWPGEIDLAPDAMYDVIKKNGRWVLD